MSKRNPWWDVAEGLAATLAVGAVVASEASRPRTVVREVYVRPEPVYTPRLLQAPRPRRENRKSLGTEGFEAIERAIRRGWSYDEKLAIIKSIAPGHVMTAKQAAKLIRLMSFDGDRLQAAKYLWESVSDKNRIDRVLDTLRYYSRSEFLQWAGRR